jgi:hypothetical protein
MATQAVEANYCMMNTERGTTIRKMRLRPIVNIWADPSF